jgi:hypothetical protein
MLPALTSVGPERERSNGGKVMVALWSDGDQSTIRRWLFKLASGQTIDSAIRSPIG